jgi:hypothetical protein
LDTRRYRRALRYTIQGPSRVAASLNQWTFPITCQRCGLPEAVPHENHTPNDRNQIEISLRCDNCQHEWRETFDFPSVFMPEVRRRRDRRKSAPRG